MTNRIVITVCSGKAGRSASVSTFALVNDAAVNKRVAVKHFAFHSPRESENVYFA